MNAKCQCKQSVITFSNLNVLFTATDIVMSVARGRNTAPVHNAVGTNAVKVNQQKSHPQRNKEA
jgi:hypothetical protein